MSEEKEKLEAAVAEEKKERAARCLAEIQANLDEHQCAIKAVFHLSENGIMPEIKIVPL